jgi:hypothetical protein
MSRGLNEEETAVDPSILDVPLTLGRKLFSQVGGVLIFDVFDDRVPAVRISELLTWEAPIYSPSIIVDLISIPWGVNNVQPQAHTILFNDVGDSLDLGGGSNRLIWAHSSFRINEMRSEDGVDEGGFS